MKIKYSIVDVTNEDLNKMNKIILSGWLAHGKASEEFEEEFKSFTKSSYATTVSSCTAGLHLSCLAIGITVGDEVIVPAQTHTATAHAVSYTGAKPVFADIDYTSGNISLDSLKSKINSRTKAIIPVHMAGKSCDMNEIKKIAGRLNIKIIEDCAHALGTTYNNIHAGNFGISGNFSFYPTKQITTGEGGMVISNNKKLIEKIKTLKAFGTNLPPNLRKKQSIYDVNSLGFNYRMTDFQASIGLSQLLRYKKNLKIRLNNAKIYNELINDLSDVSVPKYSSSDSYFVFQILLKSKLIRDKVADTLKKNKIGYGIQYATPVPLLKYYKNKYGYKTSDFPNAINYSNTCISLPVHQKLNKSDITKIIKVVSSVIG